MSALPQRGAVRFAGAAQLAKIALHPFPAEWPPPDTHMDFRLGNTFEDVATRGALNWDVVADVELLPEDGFWWTTLGQLLTGSPEDSATFGPAILALYITINPGWFGSVAAIPVYWEAGKDVRMRWIRSTFRGTLGGTVEQFQFKLDWGNPGSDPEISDVQGLALAEQLATLWGSHWIDLQALFSTDVRFTEVGVVSLNHTGNTDSHGEGGNLDQDFDTRWFAYTVPNQPVGTGTTSLPYEVACAVTLQTDHRGPSGRGRAYLPPFAITQMGGAGCFSNGAKGSAGTAMGAFLDLVEAETPYVPVVVSRRRGILNRVTSINVGQVPDSQRRRRRSQDEARITYWVHP